MKKRRPVKLIPPLAEELKAIKHASHDQGSHGNWARGGGGARMQIDRDKDTATFDSDIDSLVARSYGEAGAGTLASGHLMSDVGGINKMTKRGIMTIDTKDVVEAAGGKAGMDAFFAAIGEDPNAQDAASRLFAISNAMEEIANSEGIMETIPDPQGYFDWAFDKYEDN